ncbi:MAG: LysM peptidoglycan-binding domain-containing protein [Lachnotalea sp.]
MDIYIVQPDDNIHSISTKFGISAKKLIQDNGLDHPNELVSGQTLVIAYPEQVYIAQEGDTLVSIADLYDVSQIQLLRNNPFLSNRNIFPGDVINISFKTTGKLDTNGFVYPYIDIETLKKTLPFLTYITIYNCRATERGETLSFYDDLEIVELSKKYGTIPLLLISTLSPLGEPDIETTYSLLLNPNYQENLYQNILNTVKTKGYLGINIVINYINSTNQRLYKDIITNISDRIKEDGYIVFVTINTSMKYHNNKIYFENIDYNDISQYIHNLTFLQFIWGTNYGPPLPVNSINDMYAFINHVISEVPSHKVSIGISLISYDWILPYVPGTSYANSLSINSALELAHDVGATILFDSVSQTPFFTYRQYNFEKSSRHIVWSIDARSILAITNLVSDLELNGIGLWNVMMFLPQLWLVINSQYEIVKLISDEL